MSVTRSPFSSSFGRPAFRRPLAVPEADTTSKTVSADIQPVPAISEIAAPAAVPARPRSFGGFSRISRVLKPVADAVSVVSPMVDSFQPDGFSRFEGPPKPGKVSADAWQSIFPPDRQRVLTLAGRRFIAGHDPDEAVRAAAEDVVAEYWATGDVASRLAVMARVMPDSAGRIPPAHVATACEAVRKTALLGWREILAYDTPARGAWWFRRWPVAPGTCLACGHAAVLSDKRYKSATNGEGDAIHAGCQGRLADIGRTFGELVVTEALAIQANPPVVTLDPHDAFEGDDDEPDDGDVSFDGKKGATPFNED